MTMPVLTLNRRHHTEAAVLSGALGRPRSQVYGTDERTQPEEDTQWV
jgi:hypothetical protein